MTKVINILKVSKEQKKLAVVSYLEYAPVYKFAAMSVGISEDTLKNWRDEDQEFADQCKSKIAEFVKRTVKRTRPEFQLERLLRDDFAQRQELTGKEGKDLPAPILGGVSNVHTDNSDK